MDAYMGEIRMSGGAWAWRDWTYCDGQILSIGQYTTLFSIIGTTFGGNGRTTFGLPNLKSSVPVHSGQGPGLSNYRLGMRLGWQNVVLTDAEMPPHTHAVNAFAVEGTETGIERDSLPAKGYKDGGAPPSRRKPQYVTEDDATSLTAMNSDAISFTGNHQAHYNEQPYLVLAFLMCMEGQYPPRS